MSKFYILNGPPGIGKDTIAKMVTDHDDNFVQLEFKDGLYSATARNYGVVYSWFRKVATDRVLKETSLVALGGKSPREAMIDTSENYIKPKYGKSYFGRELHMASRCHSAKKSFVVSDGGFVEESMALVDRGHEVHVVQLMHPDFNFNNDSRNYIIVPGAYIHHVNVICGDPEAGYLQLLNIITNGASE